MKRFLASIMAVAVLNFASNAISAEIDEQIATVINVNGFLCARVISVRPLEMKNIYEVRCVEYRNGSGTVDYIMNAATGIVYKRN